MKVNLLILTTILFPTLCFGELFLEITKGSEDPYKVAMIPFEGNSRLSKELVESMFEAGEIDPNLDGRFYFSSEDYYIRYYMLDGRLMMETYPGKYGEEGSYADCEESDLCTQIEVPVDSFSIYG